MRARTCSHSFSPVLPSVLRGIAKYLLQWEREALASGGPAVFDRDFIAEHTHAVDAYLEAIDATPWARIEQQSGLDRDAIGQAAETSNCSSRSRW